MRRLLEILLLAATSSIAGPLYFVECGVGTTIPCPVSTHRTPTAAETAGLTNDLFVSYWDSFHGVHYDQFRWSITDSNSSGTIIGLLFGPDYFDTSFIYYEGNVVCCEADYLWLQDINDNGEIVGVHRGGALGLQVYTEEGDLGTIPDYVNRSPLSQMDVDGIVLGITPSPVGIDNYGNINFGNQYALLGADPLPEPGTWPVGLGTALVIGWRVRRRRWVSDRPIV